MKKLKRAVIKEEYVAITGDYMAAIILNQFIYWVDRMKTVDEYIEQENQRAKANGKTNNIELSRGWIYKTAEELNDELMLGVSANTIRKYIKVLLDKGFLHERRNPAHKWDRTLQYRVDLVAVGKALRKCGYVLSDYKIELQDDEETDKDSDFTPIEKFEVHNEGFEDYNEEVEVHNAENFETIPETTTETPSERKKERKKTSYDEILSKIENDDLRELYYEFIKMRKLIKSPMTDRALNMLINKVNKFEPDDISKQKQILEGSILNNWKDVYPLNDKQNNIPIGKKENNSGSSISNNDGNNIQAERDEYGFLKNPGF